MNWRTFAALLAASTFALTASVAEAKGKRGGGSGKRYYSAYSGGGGGGCGSRGGPGYRKANGQCASWKDR